MTMLEKIAEAMCAQCAAEFGGPAKLAESPARDAWISSARAALKALREPDDEMVGIVAHQLTGLCNATCCHKTGGWGGQHMHPQCECREIGPNAWRAAIDSILATHPQEQER